MHGWDVQFLMAHAKEAVEAATAAVVVVVMAVDEEGCASSFYTSITAATPWG